MIIKKVNIKNAMLLGGMALLVSLGMSSCKGRTMENMEPTGDTVEVTIDYPDAALERPDSVLPSD